MEGGDVMKIDEVPQVVPATSVSKPN